MRFGARFTPPRECFPITDPHGASMKLVFPGGEHPHVFLGPGVNRVGSDPQANIVLAEPGVRPQHCELVVGDHGVTLQVPQGAVVRVNGRPVDGLITLRPGDSVNFEHVLARLMALDASVGAMPQPANDDPGVTAIRPVLPRFVLRGVSAEAIGRSHPVSGPVTVGRASDCGVRLGTSGLSRHHARLIPTNDGLQLEDLGSTNGSFINGERVQRGMVQVGDELGFDVMRFRLEVAGIAGAAQSTTTAPLALARAKAWWIVGAVIVAAVMGYLLLR
jgi:pSer/pThr/pTyr-binding forkhead associated (FHA) protein